MNRREIFTWSVFFYVIFLVMSALPVSADMDWNVLDLSPHPKESVERIQNCKECHQEIYDIVLSLPGKHSIVVLRDCKKCHLADRTRGTGYRALGRNEWRQIEIRDYSNEHLVRLRNISDEKDYFLQADIRDRAGVIIKSQKILFRPQDVSEYWVDDGISPTIKSVGVDSINISVLPSADIVVKTDKMVKLKISYGLSKKYNHVSLSDRYRKKHIIRLKGLQLKKRYHFNVAASDPFDNTTVSEDFTFQTDATLPGKGHPSKPEKSRDLILYPPKIVRFASVKNHNAGSGAPVKDGPGLAVFITSNNEVTASLRLREADAESLKAPESQFHGKWGLKGRLESGIDVCGDCHFQGASHPVGMRPKRKTVVPKELPTAKGGVMTCATCHNPHGSKFPFLARIDFSKKLCTLCHQGNFL